MSQLFSPLRLRELTFKNRVFVSPMCQYSSDDGLPTDWHLVHLGSRAVGGAALVMVEATSVTPEGRITPWDSGIWSDAHAEAFRRITAFVKQQGAVPGMQLAHAGRKASCDVPWRGGKPLAIGAGGWQTIGPSPIPFDVDDPAPRAMTVGEIDQLVVDFSDAAHRALQAGFEVVEVHGGSRLFAARISLAVVEPTYRRLRRLVAKPRPTIASGCGSSSQDMAGKVADVRAHFRDGLGP